MSIVLQFLGIQRRYWKKWLLVIVCSQQKSSIMTTAVS